MPQLVALVHAKDVVVDKLQHKITALEQQLDWFRRQIFGKKSERFAPAPDPTQMYLGELAALPTTAAVEKRREIAAHTRRAASGNRSDAGESLPFFDESRVPMETIRASNPEVAGLSEDQYEVIGEKVSHRLAQRPGSYVVLKYVRPVIKRRDTQVLSCPPAPVGVIEGSRADVSFIAGMIIDKFVYHQPLHRQHLHLGNCGIEVSRAWLTQVTQKAVALMEPVFDAQFESVRASRVKAMDETPIKAGRAGPGKMKTGYFWPVYGELDEICFLFYPSRSGRHVQEALGLAPPAGAVLQTDGYPWDDPTGREVN